MKRTRRFLRHGVGAVRILLTDSRIPRPIRWGGSLALLPIPGPVDEVVLLLVAAVLWLFYRPHLREAWSHAEEPAR